MRSCTIVMFRPGFERLSDVCLVERNDEIQALATGGPYESLAKRVRLRRFVRCLQDKQPQCFQGRVQFLRVNPVTIIESQTGTLHRP